MASIKEQLEAKRRRTASVLIPVEDARREASEMERAKGRLALALAEESQGDTSELEAELEAAVSAWQAKHAEVVFQALGSDVYEGLLAPHYGAGGDLDPVAATPVLAAACAVDEDLQDIDWWIAQVASDRWSRGERADLFTALLQLNVDGLYRSVPKG
ncbi:hypothetical protein GCM10010401_14250 [Rarobacter faecitabidus]|uniref:Uncharacterized protein n=1 Tax=Rarobacter faecitabidus TaxID=13243 RepID=A0A542ZDX8_RARFA|nr:hypothetical protein [Rarobacter faecitabidus]TQL58528.1 hypothetical protein FB461_1943 [Rarobacter faecitabidus]